MDRFHEEDDARPIKELFVRSRVYNNLLREARLRNGYVTCSGLSRAAGVCQGAAGKLETFKASPRRILVRKGNPGTQKDHGWNKTAKKIAQTLCVDPEDLWPEEFWSICAKPSEFELSIDEARAIAGEAFLELPDPSVEYDHKEMRNTVGKALARLSKKSEAILRDRFGFDGGDPMTYRDIATQYDITVERVRQITEKGLAVLRKPYACKALRLFNEE